MSKASALFSEDSDSISFYSAAQAGIKIFVVSYDVDGTTNKPLQIIFGIYKQKGIGSLRLNEHINITALMVFTTCYRTEKPKRLNAIVVTKCSTTALQEVYVFGLTHTSILFYVANLRDFPDKTK